MPEDLELVLIIIGAGVPIGLILGIAIRKLKPAWSKRWTKFSINRPWKILLFAVILFSALSVFEFLDGRPYFGAFFAAFAALELIALLTFGFKFMTPEQEKAIDESNPTKLFPWRLTKTKTGS